MPISPWKPCCQPCYCGIDCPTDLDEMIDPRKVSKTICSNAAALIGNYFYPFVQPYVFQDVCEADSNPVLSRLCREPFSNSSYDLHLEDLIPVTDLSTNMTYRNIHCARCVGLGVNDIEAWSPRLECTMLPSPIVVKNPLHIARSRPDCYIVSRQGSRIPYSAVTTCSEMYIETCNTTGLWKSYDAFTESACLSFESVYSVIGSAYRNVFCAKCNGQTIVATCYASGGSEIGSMYTPSFTILLQFNLEEDMSNDPSGRFRGVGSDQPAAEEVCQDGYIMDAYTVCICIYEV